MLATKIIDYRDLIERTTANFVGRQWVRQAIYLCFLGLLLSA